MFNFTRVNQLFNTDGNGNQGDKIADVVIFNVAGTVTCRTGDFEVVGGEFSFYN